MKTIVFDAHCDTPVELWRKGERLRDNSGQVSLRRAKRLDGWVQFFSFCTPWMNDGLTCPQRYAAAYDCAAPARMRRQHCGTAFAARSYPSRVRKRWTVTRRSLSVCTRRVCA